MNSDFQKSATEKSNDAMQGVWRFLTPGWERKNKREPKLR